MSDAELYIILVDKSIAFRKANDLSLDDETRYSKAARELILSALDEGRLGTFFDEVDEIREAKYKN